MHNMKSNWSANKYELISYTNSAISQFDRICADSSHNSYYIAHLPINYVGRMPPHIPPPPISLLPPHPSALPPHLPSDLLPLNGISLSLHQWSIGMVARYVVSVFCKISKRIKNIPNGCREKYARDVCPVRRDKSGLAIVRHVSITTMLYIYIDWQTVQWFIYRTLQAVIFKHYFGDL